MQRRRQRPNPTQQQQEQQQSLIELLRESYSRELEFYREYHQNGMNNALHVVCVPMEWLAFLTMTNFVGVQYYLSFGIACYYLLLNSKVRHVAAVGHVGMAYLSSQIFSRLRERWWMVALVALLMQITAWSLQVCIGHKILEGNSPAMTKKLTLNSIVLSVLLAWDI
jgi:uncharacterized membrane protein YGL010W